MNIEPIKKSDIKVSTRESKRRDDCLEVVARLDICAVMEVAKDQGEPQAIEMVQRHVREYLRRRLYGKVQEDARHVLDELHSLYFIQPYHLTQIHKVLLPLLHAGEELR